jgi:hypothetical protein
MEGPKLCIERIIKRGNKVYKEEEEMRISRYTGKELWNCFSQPCWTRNASSSERIATDGDVMSKD